MLCAWDAVWVAAAFGSWQGPSGSVVLWLCGVRRFGTLTHMAMPWCRAPVQPRCGAAVQVFVDEISCIGCGKCVRACPQTFEIEASKYGRARVIAQAADELEDIQVRATAWLSFRMAIMQVGAWAEVDVVCCVACAVCQVHAVRNRCTGSGWEPPQPAGATSAKGVFEGCMPNFISTLPRRGPQFSASAFNPHRQ